MSEELELEASRVFFGNLDFFNDESKRVCVNEGSSRSTKTYSIVQLLIYICTQNPGIIVTGCREKMTWVRLSIYLDFKKIMQTQYKMWSEKCFNKTEMLYTFPNKSTFQFMGIDDPDKVHGYKSDILWINEAIQVKEAAYKQLAMRTTKKMFLDYNPNAEQHWIYSKVIPRDDCIFIKSTYKDNPWLEDAIVKEIERMEPTPENIEQGTADEILWKIYGLGERAAHQGLIFGDAKIVKEMPKMEDRKKTFYGMDFGFTNDPTALVEIALAHGELWFKQVIYKRGLVNRLDPKNPERPSIEGMLIENNVPKSARIWADAAEPKTIEDLVNAGWYMCEAAKKGPDSIVNGIMSMKRYNLNITECSIDFIKERDNWKWLEDKEGNATNRPIDNFNHCFVADTLVTTSKGNVKIIDIKPGDMVLTSKGFRKVLDTFYQGKKYTHEFEIFTKGRKNVLRCTDNHNIKTENEWKEINLLKKRDKIYLLSNSTERHIENTKGKSISQEEWIGCIGSYGLPRMDLSQRGTVFTTSTRTPETTTLKTSSSLKLQGIYQCMQRVLRISLGMKNLRRKVVRQLGRGMDQKRVESGIASMQRGLQQKGLRGTIKSVRCVELNTGEQSCNCSVTQTVNQCSVEKITKKQFRLENVYDIAVDGEHEFFANGVLVHNCWDAARYGCIMEVAQVWKEDGSVTFPDRAKKNIQTIEDKIKFLSKRHSDKGWGRNFE